jgi:glutathione synthase
MIKSKKTIKMGVLMDDIAHINPKKDTSFAMILEAQHRGWAVYTFDSNDMYSEGGEVLTRCVSTVVIDETRHWFEVSSKVILNLAEFDVILMRKDPPFDMNYIYATYLLEQAEKSGVLVVNKPQSLRDANEKLFALNFPHCIPRTLVSSRYASIEDFIEQEKTVVVKPLDGMGGHDIFKFSVGDRQISTVLERLTQQEKTPIMVQEFLPEIAQGDKRILLIDGEPIKYCLARIPAKGSFKGNLAAGATGVGQALSERDYYLCQQIAPTLKDKGLMFVGLDVIGDYITEINVTSPTGVRELDSQFGLNIAAVLMDTIKERL